MLKLAAIPAEEGDCLVISYGDPELPHHIIIDCGRKGTHEHLKAYLKAVGARQIELLVITHVDADHIEGSLEFLEKNELGLEFEDIWFNGYRHLMEGLQSFGPEQGERLTRALKDLNWNSAVAGGAIRIDDDGQPRAMPPLRGGMAMTVLSPDREKLRKMEPIWERKCREAGLLLGAEAVPEPVPAGLQRFGSVSLEEMAEQRTPTDTATANGTSIALLAEFQGRRLLLSGDSHPDLLIQALRNVGGGERVRLDLFKVPHHGSQSNVTNELMLLVDCDRFLISTSGARFRHPDEAAIARILTRVPGHKHLHFNYAQEKTLRWDREDAWKDRYNYECHFPAAGDPEILELD